MELSLVSVVVLIYNVEKYLAACVDSIVAQTYKNLEIILVDDGSMDSSGKMCDEYAKKDARVRVIHKENGGSSSAREAGISSAEGKFITLVDGDDWIDPETIEECVKTLYEKDVECVLYSYSKELPDRSLPTHIFDGDKVFRGEEAEDKVYRRLFGIVDDELAHPEKLCPVGSCCMKLYRVEDAKKGKFYPVAEVGSAEDALFNMYALYGVQSYAYIDKCFYHYRKISSSLTNTYRPNLMNQWNRLYDLMAETILEKGLGERYSVALENYMALNLIGFGANELSNKNAGFFYKKRKIKEYISQERIANAYSKLDTAEMSFKWRVFVFFARHKFAFLLTLVFFAINILKKKFEK